MSFISAQAGDDYIRISQGEVLSQGIPPCGFTSRFPSPGTQPGSSS